MDARESPSSKQRPRVPRAVKVALLFGLTGLLVGGAGLYRIAQKRGELPPPPELYEIPSFQLLDQAGHPFGSDQLRGRIWIANFIFTSCPSICPVLTKKMATIQSKTPAEVRLVSFSVDPERDTPEALTAYAEEYGADSARWSFLTGPLDEVKTTIVDGFKQPLNPEQPHENLDDVNLYALAHSIRFVLVDRNLRVRGFYHSDEEGMDLLLRDLDTILQEQPNSP